MIIKSIPEPKTLTPKSLKDILFNEEKRVNVIENIMQRELVWGEACIETLWHDIVECIKSNVYNAKERIFNEKRFENAQMIIGSLEYSEIDKCNYWLNERVGKYDFKSIVDGSQRLRLMLFLAIAFLYTQAKAKNDEYVDMSFLKIDGKHYKFLEAGIDKLERFYKKIEETPVLGIQKMVDSVNVDSYFNKFNNENEKDYFEVFLLLASLIESDIIGHFDLEDAFKISMENIWLYEEYVPEEVKFERFVDRNKKTTPMSDESLYPKYIINQFSSDKKELVYEEFKKFKEVAENIQNKKGNQDGRFRTTKSGQNATIFIMILALKICLANEGNDAINLKRVFASTFDLGNIEFGVEKCFRNGFVFNTAEGAMNYFKVCYKIAVFLRDDSFSLHNNIYEDNYYLRDFAKPNVIWWYFINPAYIASTIKDTNRERFEYIKGLLFRLYSFYIVHRSSSTNSQNLINLLENISSLMITSKVDNDTFKELLNTNADKYIETSGGYAGLSDLVDSLTYGRPKDRNAMEHIFITMEYDILSKNSNIPRDVFYSLWDRRGKKKNYHLDHWYPQSMIPEEDKDEYTHIGNLVLLEEGLNCSKQDDVKSNDWYYIQSKFIQTLLMNKSNRGTFNNNFLDFIDNYPYLVRFDSDEINNPTKENMRKRRNCLTKFFVDFIKDFIENKDKNDTVYETIN